MILWIILLTLAALVLVLAWICFYITCYVPKGKKPGTGSEIELPTGEIYEPFHGQMEQWAREARALPKEEFFIRSYDGLKLRGVYYERFPGAPIELMFHGYRGSAERDLSGGVYRSGCLGHNAFVVDQRCSGGSDGNVITFGVREYRDCLSWVDFLVEHFGPDRKIILTGISMGGATVLNASGQPLPENVIGVLADCGFTSPKAIICKVMAQIGLPAKVFYPLTRLGMRLFGGFDPEEISSEEAVKNSRVPVIFFHGEADDYVPCDMSRENYEACPTRKALVTVPGAGHGLAFPVQPERYLKELGDFFPDKS